MGEGRTDTDQHSEATTSRQRVTVAQASEILGITVEAVRGRIKRGTLEHRRISGTVYVLLPADQMPTGHQPGNDQPLPDGDQSSDQPQSDADAVISAKDETIATLREQLKAEREGHAETRHLLFEALTKIPAAIEPPTSGTTEPRESSVTVEEASEGSEPRSYTAGPQQATQGARDGGLRGLRRRILGW